MLSSSWFVFIFFFVFLVVLQGQIQSEKRQFSKKFAKRDELKESKKKVASLISNKRTSNLSLSLSLFLVRNEAFYYLFCISSSGFTLGVWFVDDFFFFFFFLLSNSFPILCKFQKYSRVSLCSFFFPLIFSVSSLQEAAI